MPETEVDTFAGIDVSARELSVALRRGKGEDKPAIAKFSNHHAGHKALIAHLFRGGRRVRVCLEASGNYSLDLALTLRLPPNPATGRRLHRLRGLAIRR